MILKLFTTSRGNVDLPHREKTNYESDMKYMTLYMSMRDREGRRKEASKVKQTTKQSNTSSHFSKEK